jgi:ubiquinone/menaquinone biosynthesis C-methylase UbiE
MTVFKSILRRLHLKTASTRPLNVEPAAAYDLWAKTYDEDPPNLILQLEDIIFGRMLDLISLEDRTVVDIGCGTGRHWNQILQHKPATLTGYDVSAEMLKRLRQKFPEASAYLLQNSALPETGNASADVVISTLAVAHIADLSDAFREWNRILKNQGDVLLTDFHPAALEQGANRTFRHDGRLISVENHLHPIEEIRRLTRTLGWTEVDFMELKIDSTLKHYYEEQDALAVYERFRNTPIVYGLLLKKA